MVLHPSGPIVQRRFFHRRLPTTGAYGCLHQRLERKRRALRLDQEKGPPTPLQRQAYHSTLIPGTRASASGVRLLSTCRTIGSRPRGISWAFLCIFIWFSPWNLKLQQTSACQGAAAHDLSRCGIERERKHQKEVADLR